MKRPFALRSEIIISSSLLVGAALLFVALLLLRLSEMHLIEQSVNVHSRNTQALAELISNNPEEKLAQLMRTYATINQLESWQLRDSSGTTIASSIGVNETTPAPQSGHMPQSLLWQPLRITINYPPSWGWIIGDTLEPRYVELGVTLSGTNNRHLALQLRYSLQEIYQQMLTLQKFALSCCLAYGLVLVLTAVYVLNRAVVSPIVKLTATTQLISNGDLGQRVEPAGSRETVTLGQMFNQMASNLQNNCAELENQLETISRSNHQLQIAQHQLAQSERLASIGNLTSGIAHELGNPLSAVIGYLELLKRKQLPEDLQDLVSRALVESGRMDQLLKDMLDFASADSDSGHHHCRPLEVIRHTCTLLNNQGALKQRQLIVDLPDMLHEVTIAAHKLQQVLVNLLLNARDATANQGHLFLCARNVDNAVEISVADDGHGISAEKQRDIFDPFFTTKAPGKGRGLGLYVSYQLISASGGTLSVKEREPCGSCFTLNLPCKGTGDDECC